MPGPESATETVTSPFRCVALTSTDRLGRRELHGVREQVEDDLPDPPFVSCDDVEAAVRMERDLNAVRRCLFANHRDAALGASLSENGATWSSTWPASTLDRSRTSLMRASRYSPT